VDRRAETRFAISSKVQVTLLSSLDRQIECRMIDISATGMRFIANEALPHNEVVAVDFEDHLAVATVRNCQAYGDKYSVGTSRIHSLPKDQLPAGQPKYQQIRALLEEKGWSVEIEALDPAQLQRVQEPPLPSLEPEMGFVESPEPEPVAETPLPIPIPIPTPSAPVEAAESLPSPPAVSLPAGRSWRGRVVIAAGLVLAIATVSYLLHLMHQAPVYSAPVATAVPAAPPEAPAPEPVAAPATPAVAVASSDVHHARFTILERAWVSATADGKAAFAKVMEPGDTPELEFSKIAYVHLGNYHAVQISLDGAEVPGLTGGGALRLIELAPSGARILPWTNGDPEPGN
jgi:Domain of unknown function (DUF4115)/PilZ domain